MILCFGKVETCHFSIVSNSAFSRKYIRFVCVFLVVFVFHVQTYSPSAFAYFQRMHDVSATSCFGISFFSFFFSLLTLLAFVLHLMTSSTGYNFWSSYRQLCCCVCILPLFCHKFSLCCCPLLFNCAGFYATVECRFVSVIRPLIWRWWLSVDLLLTHFKYINRMKTHVPRQYIISSFWESHNRLAYSPLLLQQYVLLIIGII